MSADPTTAAGWLAKARNAAARHHGAHVGGAHHLDRAAKFAETAAETAAEMKSALAKAEQLLKEDTP